MATVMSALVEDLEDGDLVNVSTLVIPAGMTNMEELPDEFVRVVGAPEDVDKYHVKIFLDCGYIVAERSAQVAYDGNVYDDEDCC